MTLLAKLILLLVTGFLAILAICICAANGEYESPPDLWREK